MQKIFSLLLGIFIGLGLGVFLNKEKQSDKPKREDFQLKKKEENNSVKSTPLSRSLKSKKQENIKKLTEYLEKDSKITNDGVEDLLNVSNTTAYRYLKELEKNKIIRQVGKTGRSVYYEKIK